MKRFSRLKSTALCGPFYGIALGAAAGLKLFYRRAGADDLAWILAPTAWLTERLSGIHFEHEAHGGWISHSHRLILGSACAGVNFMTIAFLVLTLPFLLRLKGMLRRAVWLVACVALSFLLAVGTNALRIVAAARLYDMDLQAGGMSAAGLHRLLGIVLYAVSLVLAYLVVERMVPPAPESWRDRPVPPAWVPLAGYLALTLGVPLAGRAWRQDPASFLEHAACVLLVCLTLAALAWVGHRENGARPAGSPESRARRC